MAAIAELAALRQRGDIVERDLLIVLLLDPLAELAHARRVDPQPAAGGDEQLAPRRGVAAALVAADRARGLLGARDRVEQRRLADAGAAEQHAGRARSAERAELVQARA